MLKNQDAVEFARTKFGSHPGYMILWSRQRPGETQFISTSAYSELDKAIDQHAKTEDLYIAISLQRGTLPPPERGGADTACFVSGFVADIDVAELKDKGRNYPTTKTLARGLLASFSLQPSCIVDTGNGLHAHWNLTEGIVINTPEELAAAKRISTGFQRCVIAHFAKAGYAIDSVGDLARVFRIPGTFNHKDGKKRLVQYVTNSPDLRYELEQIRALGKPFMDTGANKTHRTTFAAADHTKILKGCPWYNQQVTHAESSDEPNWYAAASITSRCKDGSLIFHEYSRKHAGYNESEATQKFEHALTGSDPRTCKAVRFDLGNESHCSTCPNWGKVRSPVTLGSVLKDYEPGDIGPVPLGYDGDKYIFRNQATDSITSKTSEQLTKKAGLMDMAAHAFWRGLFPAPGIFKVDWDMAADALMQEARVAGHLPSSNIRGVGAWLDKGGRLVMNLGSEPLGESDFLYTATRKFSLEHGDVPTDLILEFLSLPNWALPSSPMVLLGWAAISILSGALPWRPHVGLTGATQAGKSTIVDSMTKLTYPFSLPLDGGSTEAGIRQQVGYDAVPIILDEFETETHLDLPRMQKVLKLIRSSSSGNASMARGTPAGKAHVFQLRCSFLVAAINLYRISAADTNRMVILEVKKPADPRRTHQRLTELRNELAGIGPKWCQMVLDNAHHIMNSIPMLHKVMPTIEMRQADNFAVLFAGAWVAMNRSTITLAEAEAFLLKYIDVIEAHKEATTVDDSIDCLNALLGYAVTTFDGTAFTVGDLLATVKRGGTNGLQAEQLVSYGVKWEDDGFYVANSHPGIHKVYERSRWQGGSHRTALLRLPGAKTTPQRRFGSARSLSIWLPGDNIENLGIIQGTSVIPAF